MSEHPRLGVSVLTGMCAPDEAPASDPPGREEDACVCVEEDESSLNDMAHNQSIDTPPPHSHWRRSESAALP